TNLARLRLHAQPAADANQGQRGLGRRAGDLERARPAGFGERAVRQERATPGCLGVSDAAGHDVVRQTLDRAAAQIDEPSLAGEPLAVLRDADEEPAALPDATAGDDLDLRTVAEDVGDLLAQPPGNRPRVEFGFDDDVPTDEVQCTGEPEHGGEL